MLHDVTQEQKNLYLLLLLQLLMVDIIKDLYNINQVLERKNPIGLSAERKKYLSKEVSKYVQNPVKKFFYCNIIILICQYIIIIIIIKIKNNLINNYPNFI